MGQCKGVPQFPSWIESSEKYRQLFNETAKELGLGLTYTGDGGEGTANVPELKYGEIEVDASQWKKYKITEGHPRKNSLLAKDVCQLLTEIERRRKAVNDEGMNVFPLEKSATYLQHKDRLLNPAERAWAAEVTDTLYDASMKIYGIQAFPQHPATLAWAQKNADSKSRFHYERVRTPYGAPKKPVDGIPDSNRFASTVPWFPDVPAFSNMWPLDMSRTELEFVNATYEFQDPIRLPWTRVLRMTADEAEKLEGHEQQFNGKPVEWLRKGENGQWYRVVNFAFDPEARPEFLRMAKVLRDNADMAAEGQVLNPQFKQFTLTMADSLESGDFHSLLAEDMKQSEGNLFMTFFPHEGYWQDGVKYPFLFEMGPVDTTALAALKEQSYVFDWLGKEVERIARAEGLVNYTSPSFDADNIRRTAIFLWPLRTGGFMRAFPRDPGGHDYPKREYPGITGHRVVSILDSMVSWNRISRSVNETLVAAGSQLSVPRTDQFVVFHETGHGAQLPQNTLLKNGKTFGDSFGKWWGVLVEPWADAMGLVAYSKLSKDKKISEEDYTELLKTVLISQVMRLYPRSVTLMDEMASDGPHITGASMFLGWLYKNGAVVWQNDRLDIDVAKLESGANSFFEALTRQAVRGDEAGYKAFARECVGGLPQEVEDQLLAGKKKIASYVLLDRGEFPDLTTTQK